MRWLLLIASVFLLLVLAVVLVGLLLPKAHRATRMAHFGQPPEVLFAAITGSQDWRGVTKTELPPDGGLRRWKEQSGRRAITFEEVASDPPRLYRSRIADKNLPFSGTWTWEIAPTADGCTCRITEEGEVSNPIFRFISQVILGQTRTIDDYLTALGKKFDQPVKIEE
jgi:Polyketide cyclase / dehydrase and lipid transport